MPRTKKTADANSMKETIKETIKKEMTEKLSDKKTDKKTDSEINNETNNEINNETINKNNTKSVTVKTTKRIVKKDTKKDSKKDTKKESIKKEDIKKEDKPEVKKALLSTPVAFIIFNRPDTTKRVFERIREARPEKLYIISDAPREGREDDVEKVAQTREYVENNIDWDCEVHKNYAETNMGCKMRVSSGITWVLQNEKSTIILEDDVLPSPDFFRYCHDMLEHYENNKRVMMISGSNFQANQKIDGQYTFSCYPSVWGWATWARAWKNYDVDITDWPEIKKNGTFRCVQNGMAYVFLKKHMDSVYNHEKDTWDYQWDFCRYKYRGLGIIPKENMIENIGLNREDATHTTGHSDMTFEIGKMEFPIEFKDDVKRDVDYDAAYIKKNFGTKKVMEILKRKLKGDK